MAASCTVCGERLEYRRRTHFAPCGTTSVKGMECPQGHSQRPATSFALDLAEPGAKPWTGTRDQWVDYGEAYRLLEMVINLRVRAETTRRVGAALNRYPERPEGAVEPLDKLIDDLEAFENAHGEVLQQMLKDADYE